MHADSPTFNLIDEPWILCEGIDGRSHSLSLAEVLHRSGELRSVGGDVPTQTFAITRLLLAVVRRAVDWTSEPLERWSQMWEYGRLPETEIDAYLARVHQRFDLLHPTEPFYQVADLHTAKGDFRPVELLLIDIPSGNKYFTTRAGAGVESLSFAEAARWVVHCHAYDIAGIKSADPRDPNGKNGKGYPIGVGWCGQLGGIIFEGSNLFQTLLLNTVLNGPEDRDDLAADLPVWEQPHPDYRQRVVLTPTGTCDLLTWQSRRIRLISDGQRIVNVLVANGDPLTSHNRWRTECMTSWRYSEPQSKKFGDQRFLPTQWDPNRAMWRSIENLLADVPGETHDRSKAPKTAHWLGYLLSENYLDPDVFIRPHAFGLHYISQSSVVEAATDDALLLRLALLGVGSASREVAAGAVTSANDAVRVLGYLAKHLAQAAGGDGDGNKEEAERVAFATLSTKYAHWLAGLSEHSDPRDQETFWQKVVRRVVFDISTELIDCSGEPAFMGREVNGRWLDTAIADAIFRSSLRKALPYAFPIESTDKGDSQ
ncbi:MAG: type I-E CRISPR-associated protein Cse1/CasA [Mycolicibacterium sp.]|nr:type I-E CRISPR-associated protein Cse1/CasA [Mycolicibacterium sp.]